MSSVHPYGVWILMPPLVAFALAVITRRVVWSLVAGVFAGSMLMAGGNPAVAIYRTWETHLWPTLIDPGKLRVYSFTIAMGAMVGVITASGGMQSLVARLVPLAKTRRRGQMAAWFLGLLIFFDDYASTLLLGHTLRPLFDRLKISRAKLAYLVDSTAAPMASLALVSTWVAVEIDYIADGLVAAGLDGSLAFEAFLRSIPYRFYVLTSLVLVPITVLMGRDLYRMHQAERASLRGDRVSPEEPAEAAGGIGETFDPSGSVSPRAWIDAVVPILITLVVVVATLVVTGRDRVFRQSGGDALTGLDPAAALRMVLGAASSSQALQYGALVGLGVAVAMPRLLRGVSLARLSEGAASGVRVILPAVAVLWTASTLSRMTTDRSVDGTVAQRPYQFQDHRLYAADYLADLLREESSSSSTGRADRTRVSIAAMPTVSFLLAAVVAFCTGTSYGTMGILLPMIIPLTVAMMPGVGSAWVDDPLLLTVIAGVLSGAVFGDHCSPISDTTILSSQSSGCDHLTHVWTQMPYALLAAAISIAVGTIPIGLGCPVWYLLPLQLLSLIAAIFWLGKGHRDAA